MTDRYAAERGTPAIPACMRAPFSLHFDGQVLTIPERGLRYPAVSGRPASSGRFDYSAARQRLANVGPIPAGQYWIDLSQMWDNAWYRFTASRAAWGNHRITIRPYPDTPVFGRGGFFIHGGDTPGSAGCIDLTHSMDTFVKDLKRLLNGLPRCYIPLIVEYPQ
ncbi:Uncharacterised protein [Bordetella ansorpii]|uniref:Tlde1 domain-containing protein n=1 Tax=Bordetella ansorpii TaxID=288768 RepID=A0A157QMT9_9BORD|nr:tlde1 domain-containing protein [Bordetella ansorpii]SAI46918.1 Uncharacterised protein [Bordetella ansorpii]